MNTLSYRTLSAKKEEIEKSWHIIDAEGKILGRLASEVARIVRGKHKALFTPHVDCGDHVIVINADKIKLTGKKYTDKVYLSHSGYPGGQKSTTPKDLANKNQSERVIEMAVRGMLPKGSLGRSLFHNLHVYAGDQHPHEAQQPKTLTI